MIRFRPCKRWPQFPAVARVLLAAWSLAVIFVLIVSHQVDYEASLCHVRSITGLPCATCGGTRAAAFLFQGDLVAALRLNPIVTLALITGGMILSLRFLTGRQVVLDLERRGWRLITALLVAAVGINWAYVAWYLSR